MCRLLGVLANHATSLCDALVEAPNALAQQSRRDHRGEENVDGWGLAVYRRGGPRVVRRVEAAHGSTRFLRAASSVRATTAIAHVRHATVAGPEPANTHPFRHGRWTFAHNGTIHGWSRVGPRLLRETPAELRAQRRGRTDSEVLFLWLVGRLIGAGVDPWGGADDTPVAAVLAAALQDLDAHSRGAGAAPPEASLLLTDGRLLLAARWRKTLHFRARWTRGQGMVAVASEPLDDAPWREIPDGAILRVDGRLRATLLSSGIDGAGATGRPSHSTSPCRGRAVA